VDIRLWSDILNVSGASYIRGVTNEVQHHLRIIVELNAEPIPAASTKREEVARLMVHPDHTIHI
jgi:hypothetical protein